MVAGTLAIVPSAGGAQWSPRYLFPAAPLLAILASIPARGSEERGTVPWVWAARAVLLGAVIVQGLGLSFLAEAKGRNARTTDQLRTLLPEAEPVITDVPWLPEVTATLAAERRILFAWSPADVERIAAAAAAAGYRNVAVIASVSETGYIAPRVFDVPGCAFTRTARLAIGERGLIVHRYACSTQAVVK
jgi:hypothetical protein